MLPLAFLILALVSAPPASAERPIDPKFELTLLGGGAFGGSLDVAGDDGSVPPETANISIDSGPAINMIAGMRPYSDEGRVVLLSYARQRTKFGIASARFPGLTPIEVDIGHVHVGGEIDGAISKHIVPFFGLTIGATHYTPLQKDASTEWFFSGGFWGGLKVPLGDHLGLRFQGRFIGTMISADSSVLCFSSGGGGCVISVDGAEGVFQGEMTAGLYFAF